MANEDDLVRKRKVNIDVDKHFNQHGDERRDRRRDDSIDVNNEKRAMEDDGLNLLIEIIVSSRWDSNLIINDEKHRHGTGPVRTWLA